MKKKLVAGALALTMCLAMPVAAFAGSWLSIGDNDWAYIENGQPLQSKWVKSGSSWYYMDGSGVMARNGAMKIGGKTYLFKPDGKMFSGWLFANGKMAYFKPNGAMAQNEWVKVKNNWYYIDNGAEMVENTKYKVGNSTYLFDKDGKMVTGWVKSGNNWNYYYSSGAQAINRWVKSGKAWFFMKADGSMASNESLKIGNSNYYFYKNGRMATGWVKAGSDWYYYYGGGSQAISRWVKSGNGWFFMKDDGKMLANQSAVVNGNTYTFNKSGRMLTGWVKSGSDWYYHSGSGAMVTNKWVGNYYLGKDGKMATNQWVGKYYVNANGKWVKGAKPTSTNKPVNKPSSPQATTQKAINNGAVLAKEELEYVNKTRAKAGKPALKWDPKLENACKIRAKELVTKFDHVRPDGSKYSTVAPQGWETIRENIAQTWVGADTYGRVSNLWNNSPHHYANRISGDVKNYCCAMYTDTDGQIYWVELFSNWF